MPAPASGTASAAVIDHRPLQAQPRNNLAWGMYWRGRFVESNELAVSGLARRAVQDAHEAFSTDHSDELLEIGGAFAMSEATHHCYAGGVLTDVAAAEAATGLGEALRLYEQGPPWMNDS